ncbi:hypothetical protein NEUTE2DRAFT_130667 [Neurospora tetrasperma FGSC 2509]|nr:hypothetical protein NEUTE2DRAFT_130667 [Neurospora tetrasperma FGSC 2509]
MRLNSGVLLELWFRGTLVNPASFSQAIFAPPFDWMPCVDSWSFILAEECGRWNDEAGTYTTYYTHTPSSSFAFSVRYSKSRRYCNLPTNTHCATSQGRQAES